MSENDKKPQNPEEDVDLLFLVNPEDIVEVIELNEDDYPGNKDFLTLSFVKSMVTYFRKTTLFTVITITRFLSGIFTACAATNSHFTTLCRPLYFSVSTFSSSHPLIFTAVPLISTQMFGKMWVFPPVNKKIHWQVDIKGNKPVVMCFYRHILKQR